MVGSVVAVRFSEPVSDPNNPLLDQTGAGWGWLNPAAVPVFFLVGVGSGSVTRNECTVPAGKVLFFPLINSIDIHVPGDGLDTPELVRQDLLSFSAGSKNFMPASMGIR